MLPPQALCRRLLFCEKLRSSVQRAFVPAAEIPRLEERSTLHDAVLSRDLVFQGIHLFHVVRHHLIGRELFLFVSPNNLPIMNYNRIAVQPREVRPIYVSELSLEGEYERNANFLLILGREKTRPDRQAGFLCLTSRVQLDAGFYLRKR